MDQYDDFRKYIHYTLATSGFALLVIIIFNLIVDPLDIYRIVKKEGFNKVKPAISKYSRIAKPIQTEWFQAKTIVFGSSRIEIGIDTTHPALEELGKPALNNAVVGAPVNDIKLLVFHAIASAPVETIIIGLDYFRFFGNTPDKRNIAYPEILAVDKNDNVQPLHKLHQLIITLLSKDVFSSSTRTLRKQRKKDIKFTAEGHRINQKLINEILKKGGFHRIFPKKTSKKVATSCAICSAKEPKYADGSIDNMALLRSILNKAQQNNIRLILFTTPAHASVLSQYHTKGQWPHFEQWKRDLLHEVNQANNKQSNNKPIELWDFNFYNDYTTEAVPSEQDKLAVMKWFIDTHHFREDFGDLILDTILLGKDYGVGIKLNSTNIEPHLASVRTEKIRFIENHL